jgi:hypothetical protein
MLKRLVAPVCVMLLGACVEQASLPTVPEQKLTMELTASVAEFSHGQSTTLTVSLTNPLEEAVRLSFPTSCQVGVYIRNSTNQVVAGSKPSECATVPSLITLQVGQTRTFTFTWSGESELGPPGSGTQLPAGSYYASAEMLADGYTGIAFPLLIVLQN